MKWKRGRSKNRNVIDIRGARKSGRSGGGGFGGTGGLGGGGGMPIPMGKGKIGGLIGIVILLIVDRWFKTGYETGDPATCDTFSGDI